MGRQEQLSKKRTRQKNLKKLVLQSIAVAGVLSVAVLAPNALQALKMLGFRLPKRQGEGIHAARRRLIEHGLVAYDGKFLSLTSTGEKMLRRLEAVDFALKKPKHWDGKWRVLIFDIPEYRKGLRDRVRRTLAAIGFIRLQNSVWLYPYDCEDLIVLLKSEFKIGKDLLYLIVDSLEYDTPWKRHFGLSL